MGGNKIKQGVTTGNQTPAAEAGEVISPGRSGENPALIFFRRVGRAFSEFGSLISTVFSNFVDSVRGACAHVEQAFRGANRDAAFRNVNQNRVFGPPSAIIAFDIDEPSDDESFEIEDSEGKEENLPADTSEEKRDFFGLDSPTDRSVPAEPKTAPQTRVPAQESSNPQVPVPPPVAATVDAEPSPAQKLFEEFSERYQADLGHSNIPDDEPALDPVCLDIAGRFQASHPERYGYKYRAEVQKKRNAATALLRIDSENKARAREKEQRAQEAKDRAIERARREALPPGQADFEDFLRAYKSMSNTSSAPNPFAPGSKYLRADCTGYAQQRLAQSPPEPEKKAIHALLTAAGVIAPVPESAPSEGEVSSAPRPADPPPPPPSRWTAALKNLFGDDALRADEMPTVYADMLMPHHGGEQRTMAWQGLRSLLSPPAVKPSSAVASDIEMSLTHRHSAATADEDSRTRLELANQLIRQLQALDLDQRITGIQSHRPSPEQIEVLKRLKTHADILRKELDARIDALLPAKTSPATPLSKIPALDSLRDRALADASRDFNAFADEFSSANSRGEKYDFVGDRAKYLRPACVAVAQSAMDVYGRLDATTNADQDRMSAALFLINEFNKTHPGS